MRISHSPYKMNHKKTQENIISLIIVWLNRILFLKLIEANLVRFSARGGGSGGNASSIKFLNASKITSFTDLNELFFNIFAKPHSKRDKDSPFFYLPYLNSSLFSLSKAEQRLISIDKLSNYKELLPYKEYSKKQKHQVQIKIPLLCYLLDFLDSYDFGSGEEYEAHALIGASVLGNVFERLNAYKEGSFYTPSAITNYMCEQSISRVVVDKFNATFAWQCEDLNTLRKRIDRDFDTKKQEFEDTLKSIRICDPAVGSGHFLVAALNKMLKIYYDLGLCGSIQREEAHIIGDEFYLSDFTYTKPKHETEPSHKIQKELFNLKKSIIENNLFGVDINPNSVEICKLRLWIELLKSSYYLTQASEGFDEKLPENYHQMQTLPNIDINIKCGNSLISNFPLDSKLNKGQTLQFSRNLTQAITEYKTKVALYKESLGSKDEIERKIKSIKNLLKKYFIKQSQTTKNLECNLQKFVENYGETFFDCGDDFCMEMVKIIKEKQNERGDKGGYAYRPSLTQPSHSSPKALDKCGEKLLKQLQSDFKSLESLRNNDSFEWRFEFPEVLNANGDFMGFDLIIGNPPYGNLLSKEQKDFCKKQKRYLYADTGDTYKLFIEKGFTLLKKNRNLDYIVPLSATSSKSNIALHQMLLENCEFIKVSSYGDRPAKVFGNAEQKVSIISLTKTLSKTKELMTTWVNKRYSTQSLKDLIQQLKFINSIDFVRQGAFCKISLPIEKDIMQKLYAQKQTLKKFMKGKENIYYRTSGNRYYNLFTNYSTKSNKENSFKVSDSNAIVALMTSNLFCWFRNAYSNNRDSYISEFEAFPIPKLDKGVLTKLDALGKKLQADIEQKANFTSTGTKEYRLRKSKHIIDEIDRLICPLYGLSAEEMEFIINYELEFRTDSKD